MKKLLLLGMVVALACNAWLCSSTLAKDKKTRPPKEPATGQKEVVGKTQAYLGLGVAPVSPVLASHLEPVLGEGRGVVVAEVSTDSPAEKAGLKPHDILINYDDQKLYSPEQLVKLVRHDKPGSSVTLKILRGGELQDVKVTLGQQAMSPAAQAHQTFRRPLGEQPSRPGGTDMPESQWGTFDSMTLTRLAENRFKAEIKYRDDEGKIETRTFEGTREELRKDINSQKHLPANEREHLLRALDLPNRPFGLDFPALRLAPNGNVIWDFDEAPR